MAARERHDSAAYVTFVCFHSVGRIADHQQAPVQNQLQRMQSRRRPARRGSTSAIHSDDGSGVYALILKITCYLGGRAYTDRCQADTVNLHIHTHQLFVGSLLIH